MLEATDDFSSEELQEMVLEVGDSEGSEMIQELTESLDNGWSPFIPDEFRNDDYFEPQGFSVGNTIGHGIMAMSLKFHKHIGHFMITVRSYHQSGSIFVECVVNKDVYHGFIDWNQIVAEDFGNPSVIDSTKIPYGEPEEGTSFSAKEINDVLGEVIEGIEDMTDKYGDKTDFELVELALNS